MLSCILRCAALPKTNRGCLCMSHVCISRQPCFKSMPCCRQSWQERLCYGQQQPARAALWEMRNRQRMITGREAAANCKQIMMLHTPHLHALVWCHKALIVRAHLLGVHHTIVLQLLIVILVLHRLGLSSRLHDAKGRVTSLCPSGTAGSYIWYSMTNMAYVLHVPH